MEQINLFGIDIVNGDSAGVIGYFDSVLAEDAGTPVTVLFINAHGVNILHENAAYRQALAGANWILNDGVGLDIAAKLRGLAFKENLNGTDLMPRVMKLCSDRKARVYLLGTTDVRLAKAIENFKEKYPGAEIAGSHNGFFSAVDNGAIVQAINDSRAEVLLVALGNPKQEIWIGEHAEKLNTRLVFGVGAYIDFESGEIVRAPRLFQLVKLEWLFRLLQEPRRLWNRYLVGNVKFLYRAFRQRRS